VSRPDPVRRAPYADNPRLGARGQRTRQRILDAALEGFAKRGYHRCSVDTIAAIAGCSRVSFYQYFESKEDLFRNLALAVTGELRASTKELEPVTGDADGWAALGAWVDRYGDIYERYRPVFHAFPAAVEADAMLAEDSFRTYQRTAHIRSSVVTDAPLKRLDDVLYLLEAGLPRVLHDLTILSAVAPQAYKPADVLAAFTDVAHRTLFGVVPRVNVRDGRGRRLPRIELGPAMTHAFGQRSQGDGGPARAAVLEAARTAFVERGYHGTRVDDIAEAAGLSHGALYRYFKNKDEVALRLAADAMTTISTTLTKIPDDVAALPGWLRDYNRVHSAETAVLRVWTDAALEDGELVAESAAVLDWGRRRMTHFLEQRGFGNADLESVVLLAFLDAFGNRARSRREVDAAADVLARGFLGLT
jgi:AcrR family transcriptional regulator